MPVIQMPSPQRGWVNVIIQANHGPCVRCLTCVFYVFSFKADVLQLGGPNHEILNLPVARQCMAEFPPYGGVMCFERPQFGKKQVCVFHAQCPKMVQWRFHRNIPTHFLKNHKSIKKSCSGRTIKPPIWGPCWALCA